ncbi:MAG: type I pantothenate kinase [Hyphomonas sp.]|nr:type I pantothenate kinase [Hyphomonas sp.]
MAGLEKAPSQELTRRHRVVLDRDALKALAPKCSSVSDPVLSWVAGLLKERIADMRTSRAKTAKALGLTDWRAPYLIGLAGSVASGKSTLSAELMNLLGEDGSGERVTTVSTDNFLLPMAALKARGVLPRKGFPESYDRRQLLAFVEAVSAGEQKVRCSVYTHETYDIVSDKFRTFNRPGALIVEGLNVLQTRRVAPTDTAFISDYFDVSIYLDAELSVLEAWYERRFADLVRRSDAEHPYYGQFKLLSEAEISQAARERWRAVNLPNLQKNIAPTKTRADIILHQDANHRIDEVRVSKHWL